MNEDTDCLEEVIANRIQLKLNIPNPSPLKRRQHLISLHATLAAKTALYISMRTAKLNNVAMAKKLNCDEKEVRRLIDPYYTSKFPRIELALNKLGKHLQLSLVSD